MTKRDRVLVLRNGITVKTEDFMSFRDKEDLKEFIDVEIKLIKYLKEQNLQHCYKKQILAFNDAHIRGEYLKFNIDFISLQKAEKDFYEKVKSVQKIIKEVKKLQISNMYFNMHSLFQNLDLRGFELYGSHWYCKTDEKKDILYKEERIYLGAGKCNKFFSKDIGEWIENFTGVGDDFVWYNKKNKIVTTKSDLLNYMFNDNVRIIEIPSYYNKDRENYIYLKVE